MFKLRTSDDLVAEDIEAIRAAFESDMIPVMSLLRVGD